jgi:aldehyde dehydrogenase (NAD+)
MDLTTVAQSLRQTIYTQGHLPLTIRKQRLQALKKAIVAREKNIMEALRKDLGKSSFETYATEIGFILEEISFTLKHLDEWTSVKKVKTPITLFPGKSYVYPEPYGVVLVVSPWNYPFQLCLSPFVGAVAAGNRVVVKPSEFAVHTSAIIHEMVSEVFRPEESQVVLGGLEETQVLLKQKFDYIFFTGSTPVGKIMMKAAAEHLTPVTLELGGKSPCIIESANIDVAAKRIAWGKFLNAGQSCVAPDYLVIPRGMQDDFIERIRVHLGSFYQDNVRASQDYTRIINEKHFDRLSNLIDSAKIALGGERIREERFIAPTILRDVEWSDKVMEDEIFGPILPLIPYDSLEEALGRIQGLPKPLAFYVFSENLGRQESIVSRMPFGGGCVNDCVVHLANPNLPFGGVGTSGIGSYHGQKSFETFTHQKSVYKQGTAVDIPLRYPPYNEKKLNWLRLLIR